MRGIGFRHPLRSRCSTVLGVSEAMRFRCWVLSLLTAVFFGCNGEPIPSDSPASRTESQQVQSQSSANEGAEAAGPLTPDDADVQDAPATEGAPPADVKSGYVRLPVAGIKLERPEGFENADSFEGFQQADTGASIMVATLPGPFAEVTRGFTAPGLSTRGMTLRSKENLRIDGTPALLLNVTQSAYGTEFAKWILVFGDEKKTRMVTAPFPVAEEAALSEKLKAVVLSAKPDTGPAPPIGDRVGFSLVGSPKMKLTEGIGKMIVYTKDSVMPMKSPEDPLFVAAPSLSKVPIGDKHAFAVQRLSQTAATKVGSITSDTEIEIDGLKGYEFVAEGKDADSGTPLTVYQVILFDDGAYIVVQGLVGTRLRDTYLPEFKSMARSLKRKKR